ncbi:MAG: hypothetical protein U1C74_28605 [Phenylobacterium sp.]|uniref:hypothetical protein n=1 Tax=Brevundimonas sp. TaxID=1871086 RepID=UPI002737CC92|nr:hypothetical protein [Brevundimonas sp.]MDP3801102.1 hypothetical protein [Brevundimonas sp.]MDZ4375360.1 hypothetical protein [Phenylobacterium sp.]
MISTKLRDALSAAAMMVIIGGPILAVLGFLAFFLDSDIRIGLAFGAALKIFFGSLIAGGVLRLLTSIDARLEGRS